MYQKICQFCGEEFETRDKRTLFCNKPECRKARDRDAYAKRKHQGKCVNCGAPIAVSDKTRLLLCDDCRKTHTIAKKYKKIKVNIRCRQCGKILYTETKNATRGKKEHDLYTATCEDCKIKNRLRSSERMKLNNPSKKKSKTARKTARKERKNKTGRQQWREYMRLHNPMNRPEVRNSVRETILSKIKSGEISYKRGKESHRWKGGKGRTLNTCLRVGINSWKKERKEQANGRCERCGRLCSHLQTHHLIPFREIIKICAERIGVDTQKIELGSKEFLRLQDEIVKYHYEQEVAIVVCDNCHGILDQKYHKSFRGKDMNMEQHEEIAIEKIETFEMTTDVYNIEVEDNHDYYANGILVSNCHEKSGPKGEHGDIMNLKFIDTLLPYTEIAVGGGDILEHPDLVPFLEKCKERKLICNATFNQVHFMKSLEFIKDLISRKLIYGVGVSLTPTKKSAAALAETLSDPIFANAVVHVINGIHTPSVLEPLYDKGLKLLVLGYKTFGRGKDYYASAAWEVESGKAGLKKDLAEVITHFKAASFDNLAIEQLGVRSLMRADEWSEFYMGEEGEFTMYVDAVKGEYAMCSIAEERFPIEDDIRPMFKHIRELAGKE